MSSQEPYIQIPKSQWDALLGRLSALESANRILVQTNLRLTALVAELEDQIAKARKDSNTSSKPPSSDGLGKKNAKEVKNSRKRNPNRKQGGQKGHKGSTLNLSANPDHIESHRLSHCRDCGGSLVDQEGGENFQRRQVFDIPAIKIAITEHRAYAQICTCCGLGQKSGFPSGISQPAQYGDHLKAFCVYLNTYQFIPYMRLRELIEDLTGWRISPGSIGNWISDCWKKLDKYEEQIIQCLLEALVLHADETGMRREGETHWIHVVSNELLTWYGIHPNRGRKAMEAFGILSQYIGTVVHDRFSSYFCYLFSHALCNAHILRELKYFYENKQIQWAKELSKLLTRANQRKKEDKLTQHFITRTLNSFQRIVNCEIKRVRALPPLLRKGKRGRVPKTEEHRLLEAIETHQDSFLKFLVDPEVPFDNNQGERDLRMVKLKQKISGCFRSVEGGEHFCRIRGYLSTIRKNGLAALGQIEMAFQGNPFIPEGVAVQ